MNASHVSLTVGIPGTTGLGVVIWKNTGGTPSVLYSGLLVGTVPTPGAATATVSVPLVAGDMLYVSGVAGNGLNARVQVFGRP
jgi:hypothetical protein